MVGDTCKLECHNIMGLGHHMGQYRWHKAANTAEYAYGDTESNYSNIGVYG